MLHSCSLFLSLSHPPLFLRNRSQVRPDIPHVQKKKEKDRRMLHCSTLARLTRMFPFLTEQQPGHFLLSVHAKPGARASAFATRLVAHSTEVDLRIAAPPVEGQANAELIRFLDEVVEQGLRELQADSAAFLQDTSHAEIVAAEAAAAAACSLLVTRGGGVNADKKVKRKGKTKDAGSGSAGNQNTKSEGGRQLNSSGAGKAAPSVTLPERVEVTLVRGGTSREKTVLLLFPGTRAQLLAILEKASCS